MALTTPTSDLQFPMFRSAFASQNVWFGHQVPDGITAIEIMRDAIWQELHVRWRVKGDPEIHEMPFEQTDEGVTAALVAMKLTC